MVGVPVHVPLAAVSVSPTRSVPLTAGAAVLAALRDCLWESPLRQDNLSLLLPELLAAISDQFAYSKDTVAKALMTLGREIELVQRHKAEADIAVAGGTDATITPLSMASFATAGLSSTRNLDPQRASRPFDLQRDSGVISEGAGIEAHNGTVALHARLRKSVHDPRRLGEAGAATRPPRG